MRKVYALLQLMLSFEAGGRPAIFFTEQSIGSLRVSLCPNLV